MSNVFDKSAIISALNCPHTDYDLSFSVPGKLINFITRASTHLVQKEIQLNQNGSTNVNCFKLNSPLILTRIGGFISTVADSVADTAECTGFYLDLWDGTVSVPLTKNDGVLTGMGVGTTFIKNLIASFTIDIYNSDQCRMDEITGVKVFQQAILIPKNGVDTYVRCNYTGANAFDVTITLIMNYILPTEDASHCTIV